ncbi:hypothetical protein MCOR30_011807 [Pyricularia oryzae]|nr:hypothetical protein MCOR30_011807 [Pyricularia oryzae]KAI6442632.1 hypothetical protein MCOR15_011391 [Pyricularia oryzae]KAI6514249.1 hypothetical protein MCOR16_010600 [Pyricularia oryzae]
MVQEYDYYEGSEVIDSVVDGGLAAFKKLPHGDKQRHRASAVGQIGRDACHNGKSALVTGHFILPNDGIDGGFKSYTLKPTWKHSRISSTSRSPQKTSASDALLMCSGSEHYFLLRR